MIVVDKVVAPSSTLSPERAGRVSDEDIMVQAAAALRSYGPTRQLLLDPRPDEPLNDGPAADQAIRVSVRNGVVILAGNVELGTQAALAARLVSRIAGVRDVINLLLADDQLQTSVAAAMHHDPRLRRHELRVRVELGRVTLMGSVPDAAGRDAAQDVAAAVRGVRGVTNQLRVGL
jgi:osmotically-inducible protein OsmY